MRGYVVGLALLMATASCSSEREAVSVDPAGPHALTVDGPSAWGAARVPTTVTFTAEAGDVVSLADERFGDVEEQCPTYALDDGRPQPGVHKVPYFRVDDSGEHTITYTPCDYRADPPRLTLSEVEQVDLDDGAAHVLDLSRPGQQALATFTLDEDEITTLVESDSSLATQPMAAVEIVPPGLERGDFLTMSSFAEITFAEGVSDPLVGLDPKPGVYSAVAGGRPGETGAITLQTLPPASATVGEAADPTFGLLVSGTARRGQWLVPELPAGADDRWWRFEDGTLLGGNPAGAVQAPSSGAVELFATTESGGAHGTARVVTVDAPRLSSTGSTTIRVTPRRPYVATVRLDHPSLLSVGKGVTGFVNAAAADRREGCARNACTYLLSELGGQRRTARLDRWPDLTWLVVLHAERPVTTTLTLE